MRCRLKLAVVLVLGFVSAAMPGTAAIPGNDNFATRTVISGANVSTIGNNADATIEPDEPNPSFEAAKSVWWTWTAPADGGLTLTTSGSSFNTLLTLFTGNILSNLSLVAFNDEDPLGTTNVSRITVNVTAGTAYQIAVDGSMGATGSIVLQLALGPAATPPPNDNFANRITITGTHLSNVTADNAGATREPDEPFHADALGGKSVWWTWTAPANGGVTLTTAGSVIDTILGVYTGNSLANLVFVAGNDEDPLSTAGLESRVTFNATSGTTYQIAIDGYDGDEGFIRLRLDEDSVFPVPSNDNFANRITLAGSNITTNSSNVGASFEIDEPMHLVTFGGKSVWWTWTAPSSGGVTLDTSGSVVDTILCVYKGSSLANLTFVAGNDEDYVTTVEGDSKCRFNVTAGTTYQIAVDGYDGDSGSIMLHLVLGSATAVPANDNFANRVVLTGSNPSSSRSNRGATLELGEPLHDASYGGKSIWWRWTAPGPGFVTVDTIGSLCDTLLAVYTGSALSDLVEVASDDESGGNYTSRVKFTTKSNVTYQIAVDGYDDDAGDITLHILFTQTSYSLAVTTNPVVAGTVGVNPLPDQGGKYAPGSVVTLTATPSGNASFTGWTGDVGSTNNPLALTMNSNKTIVADFYVPPTTKVWTGASAQSGDWMDNDNWDAGAPIAGDKLVFPAGASRIASNTNNFPANTMFDSITFGDAGYVLRGNPVSLNNGIVSTNTSGTSTISLNILLNAHQSFRCGNAGAGLEVAGGVNLGTRTLTVQATGDVILSGVISGTGGIVKTNVGMLSMMGGNSNTYTGSTMVNQGTVELSKTGTAVIGPLIVGDGIGSPNADVVRFTRNSQLASSTAVTINSSGLLDLDSFTGVVGSLTMTGGNAATGTGSLGLNGNLAVNAASAQATITGNLSLQGATRTFNVANGSAPIDLLVSAVIANGSGTGGILKTGGGRLHFAVSNTYSGTTAIDDGVLAIFSASGLGTTNQGTVVNSGATLSINGVSGSSETLNLAGGTLAADAGSNYWTGSVQLSNNSSITTATNAVLNLSGVISGTGEITKGGDGALIFSGALNNTYSGVTTVNQGVLQLSKTTSNAVPGALVIGNGTGGPDADVVRLDAIQQISLGSDVTVNSSGLLDLKGSSDSIASLAGNGHIETGGAAALLSVGHDNTSTSFGGIISGSGGFAKAGSGILVLSGDNTYSGPTSVNAGSLLVNGSQPGSAVTVNPLGLLGGTGRVGNLSSPGTVSPGASPGVLSTSHLTFTSNTAFRVELNGPSSGSGHDQLKVGGNVTLAGTLDATLGFAPGPNDTFTIIDNDANDSITGTFDGLPEGSYLVVGGAHFQISYSAGPGANDVTLTHVEPPQIACPPTVTTNTAPGLCLQSVAFSATVNSGIPQPTVTYKLAGLPIASPYVFPEGTNTVVVTATNGVPPDATCSFTVVVRDNEAPTVTCPTNVTVMAAGACPVTVNFNANAADNCSLASLNVNPPSGSAFSVGDTSVRVTATDASGNTNTCSFLVTVVAGPAPKLTLLRGNNQNVVLSWAASNACYRLQYVSSFVHPPASNAWINYSGPLATNDGFVRVTNSAASGNQFYRLLGPG